MTPARRSPRTDRRPRPEPGAYAAGLRLLARRELATAQVRARLVARGHAPAEVDGAVTRLQATGALDDGRTARAYARTAALVKGRGRFRILRELEAIGIEREDARAAVGAVFAEADEAMLLERACARHLRGRPRDAAALRRVYRQLVRLGFPPDAVARVLRGRQANDADPG